jgi:hypothetical protein
MTFFDTAKRTGVLALLGLGACAMDNPAFEDEGNADEVGDDATDTTVGDSAESGDADESGSSSSADSSDADTTDANDQSDTLDASEDSIEPDLPVVEQCNVPFNDPYRPIYGTAQAFGGQCLFGINQQYARVVGNGPAIGLLMVQFCSQGCSSCPGPDAPLGVVGLDEFTVPLLALAEQEELVCLSIQTGPLRGVDDAGCLYDSLWVGDWGGSSRLLATHAASALPFAGMELLGGKPAPAQGQQLEHCSCTTQYEDGDPNLQCCEDSNEPFVSSLSFMDKDVWPGESANVLLDGGEWAFQVAQSHLLPNCENAQNLAVSQSWALVRGQ